MNRRCGHLGCQLGQSVQVIPMGCGPPWHSFYKHLGAMPHFSPFAPLALDTVNALSHFGTRRKALDSFLQ